MKKKKRNTHKLLFKNNEIKKLLKNIKNTKKTQEELILHMETIIKKQIEKEIKKQKTTITNLKAEKEYLIKKMQTAFTKKNKSHLYPRMINSPPK